MLPTLRVLSIAFLATFLAALAGYLLFSPNHDATLVAIIFGSVGAVVGTLAAAAGELVIALRSRK